MFTQPYETIESHDLREGDCLLTHPGGPAYLRVTAVAVDDHVVRFEGTDASGATVHDFSWRWVDSSGVDPLHVDILAR